MAILASKELIQAIRRFKAGDEAAFEDIYNGSVQYITKCVLTVLNRTAPGASQDLQQDIIQDTYLTIATKLETLQSEQAFLQWAGQIATNHALRTWEKDLRQHDREQPEDEMLYELPDERFIPEDILYNMEKRRLIRNMLQELPTGQYLCLVEYFYNGLKETEVAQKLGMPLGTVKTNLSRAKKKLKDIIQTQEKKSGVKLYNMSWLLLLLWKDAIIPEVSVEQLQSTLKAVMEQLPKAAGIAAGATGAASATGAAGGAAAATKAGLPFAAKIVAGVLAATVAVGGIAATVLPKEEPEPVVEAVQYPVHGDMGQTYFWHYNDHYYNAVGPFENWDQVLEYQEEYGGYPMTVNSEEENWILSEIAAMHMEEFELNGEIRGFEMEDPLYIGLYWDHETSQWKWVNGEEVTYTNWFTEPEDTATVEYIYWDNESGQVKVADTKTIAYTNWLTNPERIPETGHFGAYCLNGYDLRWRGGTLGEEEVYQYHVAWEYEGDTTYEQRLGPAIAWVDLQGQEERTLEFPEDAIHYEDNRNTWTESLVCDPEQTAEPGPVGAPLAYGGHYYVLTGPFPSANEVEEYIDRPVGIYPASITSEEENDVVYQYFNGYNAYIGLLRDGYENPWIWHTEDPVAYTNWATDLEESESPRLQMARYGSEESSQWYVGEPDDGNCFVIFEYEYLPEFLEGEHIDMIPASTESEILPAEPEQPAQPDPVTTEEIALADEEKARMEQILLYIAYGDSGAIDPYVGQNWEEWLENQEYAQFQFLEMDTPAPTMWDKCEVLLMMGWDGDPALEGGPVPGFFGDPTGMSWSYLESVADRVITELLGDFDTSWLDGNVVAQGYTTDISGGFVYQPITSLFSENYGSFTLERIEDLGNGDVAISGVYERDFVLDCVYTAKKNPASVIGYTLTGVTYSFAQS